MRYLLIAILVCACVHEDDLDDLDDETSQLWNDDGHCPPGEEVTTPAVARAEAGPAPSQIASLARTWASIRRSKVVSSAAITTTIMWMGGSAVARARSGRELDAGARPPRRWGGAMRNARGTAA
jgi:hypothetical protein